MVRVFAPVIPIALFVALAHAQGPPIPRDFSTPFARVLGDMIPTDMAVTEKGWVFLTGITRSPNFRATPGAYDTTCGTDGACNPTQGRFGIELRADHVLALLDPDGQIHYATFLGGSSEENVLHVAFDRNGRVWLAGATNSVDFEPQPNARSCVGSAGTAVWIAHFDEALKTLQDFQCIVRSASIADLVLDAEGNAWITGTTSGDTVPVRNAWQPRHGGQIDMYVAEISPGVLTPRMATYIGGNSIDSPSSLAIAPNGAVLVSGSTTSTNFPVVRPFQANYSGPFPWSDAVLVSLDPTGQMANFSTLIGGAGNDIGGPLRADVSGNVVIALQSASDTLPTAADAYDRQCGVRTPCAPIQPDVYVAKFSPVGAMLTATYIGGSGVDYPRHLSLLSDGSIVVAGSTQSADFPLLRALPTQVVPAINTETGFLSFFDTNLRSLTQSTLITDDQLRPPAQVIAYVRDFTYIAGQINTPSGAATYLRKLYRLRQ